MIRSFSHTALRAFFQGSKPLPATLADREELLCYWLTILHAAKEKRDIVWPGSKLKVSGGRMCTLTVEGLGEFSFTLTDSGIEHLHFQKQ